jgi:deazaflavin-dependent oxidoreductase (nitroreductase family)
MSEAKPPNPPSKTVVKFFSKLNVLLYRLTGGRVMGKLKGAPICLVTMTGRKSGRKITFPLMYNPDGDNVILIASFGGGPKNPVWYYNLMANPNVVIELGAKKQEMRATQASPEQKAALWPSIVANYPDFAVYQQKTSRDIPVIICSPV